MFRRSPCLSLHHDHRVPVMRGRRKKTQLFVCTRDTIRPLFRYRKGNLCNAEVARSRQIVGRAAAFITNREVREKLNLTADRYWEVRGKLLDDGVIIIGRGYGGRVALKQATGKLTSAGKSNGANEELAEIEKDVKAEKTLYQPFADSIKKLSQCAVERRSFLAGANPARQFSLRPVATGVDVKATTRRKPLV
jgi:hypothetical protein